MKLILIAVFSILTYSVSAQEIYELREIEVIEYKVPLTRHNVNDWYFAIQARSPRKIPTPLPTEINSILKPVPLLKFLDSKSKNND